MFWNIRKDEIQVESDPSIVDGIVEWLLSQGVVVQIHEQTGTNRFGERIIFFTAWVEDPWYVWPGFTRASALAKSVDEWLQARGIADDVRFRSNITRLLERAEER